MNNSRHPNNVAMDSHVMAMITANQLITTSTQQIGGVLTFLATGMPDDPHPFQDTHRQQLAVNIEQLELGLAQLKRLLKVEDA